MCNAKTYNVGLTLHLRGIEDIKSGIAAHAGLSTLSILKHSLLCTYARELRMEASLRVQVVVLWSCEDILEIFNAEIHYGTLIGLPQATSSLRLID